MQLQELCSNKNNRQPSPSPSPSPVSHSLKFQSAYEEFIGRFTFGIEALDSPLLNLKTGDTLGIVGDGSNYRNYTNILMTRLSIRSLFSRRLGGVGSPYVITVDAGKSLDFYQYVNFARLCCLDIKEILQRIIVSRAFTVYHLADLIINELPKVIKQFDTRLVLFQIYCICLFMIQMLIVKRPIYLIKEIVSAIRKISMSSSSSPRQILGVISWNHHQSSCNDILLSKLDKHIEITHCITSRRKRLSSLLSPSCVQVSSLIISMLNTMVTLIIITNAIIYFQLENYVLISNGDLFLLEDKVMLCNSLSFI